MKYSTASIKKKLPELTNAPLQTDRLQNITVANLFFESSTRTRCSFEYAAKRLGASVINLDGSTSTATTKGEDVTDIAINLEAMGVNLFVVRHQTEGIPQTIADRLSPASIVINAGDGRHEHPTQAVGDMYTLHCHSVDFKQLKVAIIGDIAHSRVARSQVYALKALEVQDIRAVGPESLLPTETEAKTMGFHQTHHNLTDGLKDVDVVITLRIQRERLNTSEQPDTDAYFKTFGLTEEALAHCAPDVLVMHPGPINREVEIASNVADGPHAIILEQVRCGIAARMAIMDQLVKEQQQYLTYS